MNATELRAIRGAMTRKNFAKSLGWEVEQVRHYENGRIIPESRAAHVRLWVKYREALKLLKEAKGVIGQHHSASITRIQGDCPVCAKTGSVYEQNNIFYRIEESLKEGEL